MTFIIRRKGHQSAEKRYSTRNSPNPIYNLMVLNKKSMRLAGGKQA
jgi:hypothetical protein